MYGQTVMFFLFFGDVSQSFKCTYDDVFCMNRDYNVLTHQNVMHMARTPFGVFQVSALVPRHAMLMFSFIDLHSLSAMAWMRSTVENTWNKSEFLHSKLLEPGLPRQVLKQLSETLGVLTKHGMNLIVRYRQHRIA